MKCSPSSKPGSSLEALFRCRVRVSSGTATLILPMLILAASAKELPQIGLVQQAKQGHVEAQYKLGRMYDNGRGVGKDYQEGARWIQAAAEQGYAEAQYSSWG